MMNLFKRLAGNERGLTLPEYGIGLALAVGVGAVVLGGLATDINQAAETAGFSMPCTAAAVTGGACN